MSVIGNGMKLVLDIKIKLENLIRVNKLDGRNFLLRMTIAILNT
jgi:hypothetical protein